MQIKERGTKCLLWDSINISILGGMYDDGGAFDGSDGGMFGGGIEPLPQDIIPSGMAIVFDSSMWS